MRQWVPKFASCLFLVALLCAARAQAALPDSRRVLAEADKARPAPADLTLLITAIDLADGGRPIGDQQVRLRLFADGRIVQEVFAYDGSEATVTAWASPSRGSEPAAPVASPSIEARPAGSDDLSAGSSGLPDRPARAAPAWLRWFAGHSLNGILADLPGDPSARPFDKGLTSWAHDGPTILAVVGAGAHEGARPQLHIERGSWRLSRIVSGLPAGEAWASPRLPASSVAPPAPSAEAPPHVSSGADSHRVGVGDRAHDRAHVGAGAGAGAVDRESVGRPPAAPHPLSIDVALDGYDRADGVEDDQHPAGWPRLLTVRLGAKDPMVFSIRALR